MMKLNFILLFLFIPGPFFINSAAAEDFLIVDQPQSYIIYNSYEQLLDRVEKENFPPFSPFRILRKKTFLGDSLTSVIKTEWRGVIFYFGLNADDQPKTFGKPATYRFLRNCIIYEDTLVISCPEGAYLVAGNDLEGSEPSRFAPGQRLVRLFEHKRNTYVLPVLPDAIYYWIKREHKRCFKKQTPESQAKSAELSPAIKEQVRALLAGINKTYQQYFGFFNIIYKQEISAPFWQEEKDSFNFYLTGSATVSNLTHSSKLLVENMNLRLTGSGFYALYKAQEKKIYIRRENKDNL